MRATLSAAAQQILSARGRPSTPARMPPLDGVFAHGRSEPPLFHAVPRAPLPAPSPLDPAYFTGNPSYYAALREINALVRKHNIDFHATPVAPRAWRSLQNMAESFNFRLRESEYLDLVHKLNLVCPFSDVDPHVRSILERFLPAGKSLQKIEPPSPTLDSDGRSYSTASRKTARAQCWMIPGHGQIYINGVNMNEYVPLTQLRQRLVKPFEVADSLAEFNAWLVVHGSGINAQVDAAAVAIARSLAIHRPDAASVLHELKYTVIDTRQVERKKTGQPKARKKNTWVKR